jgi:hypothetical protein
MKKQLDGAFFSTNLKNENHIFRIITKYQVIVIVYNRSRGKKRREPFNIP